MAKAPPELIRLPPPTVAECWWEFLKWVVGIPLVVAGALALIWLAYWVTGSSGMVLKTESDIGTILFYLAFIVLAYPIMLVIWALELRDGLRRARDWRAMTTEAQTTAIAEAEAAALAAKPNRRKRKAG